MIITKKHIANKLSNIYLAKGYMVTYTSSNTYKITDFINDKNIYYVPNTKDLKTIYRELEQIIDEEISSVISLNVHGSRVIIGGRK